MSLKVAVRIGARRSGANPRLVDEDGLAQLGERSARAFHELTGAPLAAARDLIRVVLTSEKHPTYFESPINEHAWFECFWFNVKYPSAHRLDRARSLRLLAGGAAPCKRRRHSPKLSLVKGDAQ